jgi:hypothetical protein
MAAWVLTILVSGRAVPRRPCVSRAGRLTPLVWPRRIGIGLRDVRPAAQRRQTKRSRADIDERSTDRMEMTGRCVVFPTQETHNLSQGGHLVFREFAMFCFNKLA